MNILFVTLCNFSSINDSNIYTDLLRQFVHDGHNIFVMSPNEKHDGEDTIIIREENCTIIKVGIGAIQKTNVFRKGINMLLLNRLYKKQYILHLSKQKIDVVMYSTPPITIYGAIAYIKKHQNAFSYLLLKDIFPQNAVDLKMISKTGLLYAYFRYLEKKLYRLSDYIGCMSKANVDYILKHNTYLKDEKVGISPNSVVIQHDELGRLSEEAKNTIRRQFGIPIEKRVYIYGGNLGKPQDIPFVIECIKKIKDDQNSFFVVCGSGTEFDKIKKYVDVETPTNMVLISGLPKEQYEQLVGACDVGLIFLNYRFTIPNFPSRILSYMQFGMPVLACTDCNTDIGKVIEDAQFGWWCESCSPDNFINKMREVNKLSNDEIIEYGNNGFDFLKREYDVKRQYQDILEVLNGQV